jgi:hypothetical protein
MSIRLVETYVVRAEKSREFETLLNEFAEFKESHPEVFRGVKSWKRYRQDYGHPARMYVEMWEFANLAQLEEIDRQIFSDEGMKRISAAFHELIEPASFSASIWSEVA